MEDMTRTGHSTSGTPLHERWPQPIPRCAQRTSWRLGDSRVGQSTLDTHRRRAWPKHGDLVCADEAWQQWPRDYKPHADEGHPFPISSQWSSHGARGYRTWRIGARLVESRQGKGPHSQPATVSNARLRMSRPLLSSLPIPPFPGDPSVKSPACSCTWPWQHRG
jgi:hypothetical protein